MTSILHYITIFNFMRNCTGNCVGKKLLNLTTCDKRLLNLTRRNLT